MKLGTKTMVTLGTMMAALFLVLYAISTQVVRKGFSRLEERYARRNVDRVLRAIEGREDDLDRSVADWAAWDDMYQFAQDRNTRFIRANLPIPDLFLPLRIQTLLIADRSGTVVWGSSFDSEESRGLPVPAGLVRLAANGSPLTRFGPARDRVSGLVVLDEGPMIVAARPILTSKSEGPARGTLIMGHYLDDSELQRLADALQLKVSAFLVDALPARPGIGEALAALSSGEPSSTRALNSATLLGYGLVRDLDARPAVVIEVEMPRDILAQGLRTSSLFAGLLVLVGVIFSVAILVMLRRQIIVRLEHLSRDIGLISKEEDFSRRLSLPGSDELSTVAEDINRLLARVVESRRALGASEQRFRQIAESVGDLIWEVDTAGLYTYASPAVERILGYTAEELIGREHFYDLSTPGETGSVKNAVAHKDGHVVVVETNAVPVVDQKGTILGYRGVDRDITERKHAEEEKAGLESQLQQAQKMELVGRLAGGVAHDFNNMLGVILGHAEVALGRVGTDQPLHGHLAEIRKAAERSAALTRQLLAFARKQTIAPKVLDLNEAIAGILKMIERLVGEDVSLSWQPSAELWPVRVDPSQIDQILANLCVNARDAIADVGKVTIETGNGTFDADYCALHAGFVPGEYVRLAVSDDGCGMDKETLAHVFEPFFTTKPVGAGTGLGLATVYGIVKQNNGFINVYSEPGHGTTFSIYLPRQAGKAEQARGEDAGEPLVRGHETILLVEDEPAILEMTTEMLERQGYTVLAAATPGAAIRLAEAYPGGIHLVITDVVMPEMNGRDLARNVLSLYPHLKRLFMSGYTANVIAHRGVLDDGVHFLQKPFSMKDLTASVREALENN
jgi:PAS domain S-box-containing protein